MLPAVNVRLTKSPHSDSSCSQPYNTLSESIFSCKRERKPRITSGKPGLLVLPTTSHLTLKHFLKLQSKSEQLLSFAVVLSAESCCSVSCAALVKIFMFYFCLVLSKH
ncbi:hypothetical protein AMECASPLE_021035 [Ameca splendens]|uniref:Uncharacterized protein n=1 Tax=Ameca splendens TaxID=208324 RepID=A0ABV0ZQE1_9TELE